MYFKGVFSFFSSLSVIQNAGSLRAANVAPVFTNNMTLALNQTVVTMCTVSSTLYTVKYHELCSILKEKFNLFSELDDSNRRTKYI